MVFDIRNDVFFIKSQSFTEDNKMRF